MAKEDYRPRMVIGLEGGLVQWVMVDGEYMDALVVDYDSEGAEESEIVMVPQDGEGIPDAEAVCHFTTVHVDREHLDKVYAAVAAHDAASLAVGSDPA